MDGRCIGVCFIRLAYLQSGISADFEERFTEDSGRGAAWEIHYIKTDLYDAKGRNARFIPVLLGDSSYADIPKRMRGYRHYRYPADYRFLLERLRRPPGVLESHSTLGKRDVGLIERPDLQVMQGGSGGKAASLRKRFVYSSRTTTFVGRQEELEQLTAFCSADDTFAWMSVTGPAGIGKSRLCLELVISLANTWCAGFVPLSSIFSDWESWRPDKDSLFVFDYVKARVHTVALALAAFALRADTFTFKVRLLLVERPPTALWIEELKHSGSAHLRLAIERHEFGDPLELSLLSTDDIDAIVTEMIRQGSSKSESSIQKVRRL